MVFDHMAICTLINTKMVSIIYLGTRALLSSFEYKLLFLICVTLFCGECICDSQAHPSTDNQEITKDGESTQQSGTDYEQIPKPFIPVVDDAKYDTISGETCEKQDVECGIDASDNKKFYANEEVDDKVDEQALPQSEEKVNIGERDMKGANFPSESLDTETTSFLDVESHTGHRLLTIRRLLHSAIDYLFSPLILVRKLLDNKEEDSRDDMDEHTEAQTMVDDNQDAMSDLENKVEHHTPDDAVPSPSIDANSGISNVNLNETVDELNLNATSPEKKLKFKCTGRNMTENSTHVASVKIVNGTELLKALSFTANGSITDCIVVLFYAPWCPFCARAAPHYNALARAYPQIDLLAVDAAHFSNLNARFGTVSVPNILLFHQSRAVLRFNTTQKTFDTFVQFITNATGLEANISVVVSEDDYLGPLSNVPSTVTDYYLWLSWLFVIVCSSYIFTVSRMGKYIITRIHVLWQEHQHIQ